MVDTAATPHDPFAHIEAATPDDSQLQQVAALTRLQLEQAAAVAVAEKALEVAKNAYRQTEEVDLPTALLGCGLVEFKTAEGAKVELKTTYHASISADNKPQAFSWLDTQGHGAIIKHDIVIRFPRDSGNSAARCVDLLKTEFPGLPVDDTEHVHHATLSSFVKEQMGLGKTLPMELLGVHTRRIAVIKLPKNKKDEL